ncbi:DUF4832 domain-containing protein [Luteococcus peritonei]|uniref:DUF4832 domain-containing protein n=1 Tax=Luteococcus peritonei TaxID=88874 RepID=A0ABW4RU88_9ACTN
MSPLSRRTLLAGPGAVALAATVGCSARRTSGPVTLDRIGLDHPEIANSGRGQNLWLGQAADPAGWPVVDLYQRPDGGWRTIEKRRGQYDWTILDQALERAGKLGGRLTWRIMPWYLPDHEPEAPSWVPTRTVRPSGGGAAFRCPDWDSAGYLDSWIALVRALAAHADADPRLWAVDISGFGAWGEHFWDEAWGHGMKPASFRRIAEATRDAFPHTWVLGPAMSPGFEVMPQVFGTSGRWGTRYDFLGGQELAYDQVAGYRDLWKRGPVVTEWGASQQVTMARGLENVRDLHVSVLSSGNKPRTHAQMSAADRSAFEQANKLAGFRLGLDRVELPEDWREGETITITTHWTNHGVAPTYDNWRLELLVDGEPVALIGDLRTVLPGSKQLVHRLAAPVPGARLAIRASDPASYLPPLRLATAGRQEDGSYPLTDG